MPAKKLRLCGYASVLFLLSAAAAFSSDKSDYDFDIAVKAFDNASYKTAVIFFTKFTKEYPAGAKFNEAKLYLAKLHYLEDNYSRAIDILNEIEKNSPAKAVREGVYHLYAQIYLKKGDFANCAKYCRQFIKRYPASRLKWQVYYALAKSNVELGNFVAAEKIFKSIINAAQVEEDIIDGSYREIFALYAQKKDYGELDSYMQKYLELFPQGVLLPRIYFYKGQIDYYNDEFGEAVINYKLALSFNKDAEFSDLISQALALAYMGQAEYLEAKKAIDGIANKELKFYCRGVFYFKIKDYAQALDIFDNLLKEFPQGKFLASIYLNKAGALYELGRINDAIFVYQHILTFFPPQYSDIYNKARYGLGWCYFKNGRFKDALGQFKLTAEYANDPIVSISSKVQIADAYYDAKDYPKALDAYGKILENNPEGMYEDYALFQMENIYLELGEPKRAREILKTIEDKIPSSPLLAEARYNLAMGYFAKKDFTEAKAILDDLLKAVKDGALADRARYFYGRCLSAEGLSEDALKIFTRLEGACKDDEIKEVLPLEIGAAYFNLSMTEKAKAKFLYFLQNFPASSYLDKCNFYLGVCYDKEGNYDLAKKYYARVLEIKSALESQALHNLSRVYIDEGDFEKADVYLDKLRGIDGVLFLEGKNYAAKKLSEKGDTAKALDIYDELIKAAPSLSLDAKMDKAFFLKEIGHYTDAVNLFKELVSLDRDSAQIRFFLGWCLEKTGRNKEAIAEYTKASGFGDRDYDVKALFRIAKIYEDSGNFALAKKTYRDIMGLNREESKIAQAQLDALNSR